MNISSAIFDRSAPDLKSCPDESLPEFAFIGRSNVGKSSLLNMLAGKGVLARVSPTPGFTKLINMFTMNRTWRLVDLPGYGFAKVAREDRSAFNEAVADYLEHRVNLSCVFALIDSGLPPQPIDLEFVQWLVGNAIPFVLVFTKADRGTPETVAANIELFKTAIAGWFDQLPTIFICSSATGHGRNELLAVISETLDAIAAAPQQVVEKPLPPREVEPAFGLKIRAGNNSRAEKAPDRKQRKGARPW